jgi:hypothetical protein
MRTGRLLIFFAATAAAAGLAAAAVPQSHLPPRDASWGKAGVSLYDYRLDAAECAWQAISLDVAQTDAAKTLVRASRELDHIAETAWMTGPAHADPVIGGNVGIAYQQALGKYRPDRQFEAIRDLQYGSLETCLTQRGYSRFQLTAEQARQLRHLKRGSMERRTYLHSLASDSEVLKRQAI